MLETVFKEELLKEHLDKYIMPFIMTNVSKKGFTSSYDEVIKNMRRSALKISKPADLFKKFQLRCNLKDQEIQTITGLKKYTGDFKENSSFEKRDVCLLAICFQLTPEESDKILEACDTRINKKSYVFDCVYDFYINNYVAFKDRKENIEEFNKCLGFAGKYVQNKLMARVGS